MICTRCKSCGTINPSVIDRCKWCGSRCVEVKVLDLNSEQVERIRDDTNRYKLKGN